MQNRKKKMKIKYTEKHACNRIISKMYTVGYYMQYMLDGVYSEKSVWRDLF